MPFFDYRDGVLSPTGITTVERLVDPDEVNRRFDDIARMVNGNLGVENLRPGRIFTAAMMSGGRDFYSVHIHANSATGTWPATAVLFKVKVASVLVGVDISDATTAFAATLWDGAATICTLTDDHNPTRSLFSVTKMTGYATLAAAKIVYIKVTAGAFCGITLHFTTASEAP